jgi:riboflavin kinase/FMN adenylyltransferase
MVVTHGSLPRAAAPAAVTVGNFDGVHRGHRAMLERVAARARESGIASHVLTFEPHPREFFAPQAAPARITRLRDKLELIAQAGIARVHVARFDARFAALAAQRFAEDVLVRGLGARWVMVGKDFRFGARRQGDYAMLQGVAARLGFELESMPEVRLGEERISSSAVRAALAAGDLARAEQLLGRCYAISGRVAHGEKLGRKLGFPTANIVLRHGTPLGGIFVVEADDLEGARTLPGVASVGRRPTVNPTASPLLEVHLFGVSEELYGRHLRVRFLQRLREERKFDDLEALRDAIAGDVAQAREYFAAQSDA